MLKRYTNLFVKLFLIILLVILICIILSCGDTESVGTNTEQPPKQETSLVAPTPLPTKKPDKKPKKQEPSCSDKIKRCEEEYYYATKVWKFLRREGFNQEITCAILGNMMIETSGGSLELKPTVYSPDGEYYGLCQWSKEYYPEAHGISFEQQLDFLLETIAWEINTFGKNYKDGFTYKDFLVMTDVEDAALAFAKSYERCRPASYELRQEAALKAYEYFNLEY